MKSKFISREAARTLQAPLAVAKTANGSSAAAVVLDFAGISGVAPSFVGEMIKILEELLTPTPSPPHGRADCWPRPCWP